MLVCVCVCAWERGESVIVSRLTLERTIKIHRVMTEFVCTSNLTPENKYIKKKSLLPLCLLLKKDSVWKRNISFMVETWLSAWPLRVKPKGTIDRNFFSCRPSSISMDADEYFLFPHPIILSLQTFVSYCKSKCKIYGDGEVICKNLVSKIGC